MTVAILIGLIFGHAPHGFSLGDQSHSFFKNKHFSKNDTRDHESSDSDSKSPASTDKEESSKEESSDCSQLDGLKPTVAHWGPSLYPHSKLLLVNSDFILSYLVKSLERPPKFV